MITAISYPGNHSNPRFCIWNFVEVQHPTGFSPALHIPRLDLSRIRSTKSWRAARPVSPRWQLFGWVIKLNQLVTWNEWTKNEKSKIKSHLPSFFLAVWEPRSNRLHEGSEHQICGGLGRVQSSASSCHFLACAQSQAFRTQHTTQFER